MGGDLLVEENVGVPPSLLPPELHSTMANIVMVVEIVVILVLENQKSCESQC